MDWTLASLHDDGAVEELEAVKRKRVPISAMIAELTRVMRPIVRNNPTASVFVEQQSVRARDDMQKLAYATLGVCAGLCCDSDAQSASFISAQAKSRWIVPHLTDLPSSKPAYAQRKRAGIEACRTLLLENGGCEKWIEFFDAAQKRDDLADSLLLAVAALARDIKADRVIAIDVGSKNCGLMVMEALS